MRISGENRVYANNIAIALYFIHYISILYNTLSKVLVQLQLFRYFNHNNKITSVKVINRVVIITIV